MKQPKQVELSKRGAAAMAVHTAGRSRCLAPNRKRDYDRRDRSWQKE